VDIKQHATELPMKQRRNQNRNKKIPRQRKRKYTQNLQDAAKAAPRGKFIVIKVYINKQKKFQINNPTTQKTRKKRTN